MTIAFDAVRTLALVVMALLSTAATNQTAGALHRAITIENIQHLVGDDEVERLGRPGLDVVHGILDLLSAAHDAGDISLAGVEEWLGLEFAQAYDEDDNPVGSTLTVAAIDLVNTPTADAKFEEIRGELFLTESDQGIGDRFAGLAPKVPGLHTVVLFRTDDKVVVMTTSTAGETDPEPLLSSEALVDLARLVAPRLEP